MRRRGVLQAALAFASVGAYGAVGSRAQRISVTNGGQSRGYGPIASRQLAGTADCRVADDGTVVYVATGDGVAVIALPNMEELASVRSIEPDRDGGPLTGIADLAIDGDRLLVPGPAGHQPDRIAGFGLFDISDPSRPDQVAFYETTLPIHNAALFDGSAYLTAGNGLDVVDVTDDEPVEVGQWSLANVDPGWNDVSRALWPLHDIRIREDLAVLSQWDAGTWLVDVTSPDDIAVLSRVGGRPVETLAAIPDEDVRGHAVGLPGNHHSAALSDDGSLLAVGAEAFEVGELDGAVGPGGIDLYDITDPSNPAHLSTIDAPAAADETRAGTWTTAHDFTFDGDRLLSAWYQAGVRIHDLDDPTDPRELVWWRRPREVACWTARPAAADSFVVSTTSMPDDELIEGVFLFRNRPGMQVDPPSLTDPSTPTATHTPSLTPTATPTPTAHPTTRSDGQRGFGQLSGLAGLAGLAAWRRFRRT